MFFISVVRQYERAVIFRLGRYIGTKGPGLIILIPFVDRGVRVDLREVVLDEPAQSSITKDNALVDIDFIIYMQVVDPESAIININNYTRAVRNLATTTLRSVIGDITVEQVLSEREAINARLLAKMASEVDRWGVQVNAIEIREILPHRDIQDAMTRLLTADRTKRASITESEGDRQSSINVAEGSKQAAILEAEGFAQGLDRIYQVASGIDSKTMGLQYLEMMKRLGEGESTKWIIPMDLASMAGSLSGTLAEIAAGAAAEQSAAKQ